MTRDDFIKRWKFHLAGGFVYGYHADAHMGPAAKAQYQHEITKHVDELLGHMFDSIYQQKPKTGTDQAIAGRVNGTAK